MMEWKQAKWRIVIPKATMYKFFGDSWDYVIESIYNSFDKFRNYLQTGRIGMFEVVDGMLMECDAETDFDCFIPDGTFSECTTVNELVAALERVIENERKKEDENG